MARSEQSFYYRGKLLSYCVILIVSTAAIGAGTYLIVKGHSATGIGMILGSLATFAGAIIYKREGK